MYMYMCTCIVHVYSMLMYMYIDSCVHVLVGCKCTQCMDACISTSLPVTDLLVGVNELCPGIACEHADDGHLTPLVHIYHQVAQFAIVLVNQVNPLRAHHLICHHHATCNKLKEKKLDNLTIKLLLI